MTRDLLRLIEATLMLASPMQRNRYDVVDVLDQISATNGHLYCEVFRK